MSGDIRGYCRRHNVPLWSSEAFHIRAIIIEIYEQGLRDARRGIVERRCHWLLSLEQYGAYRVLGALAAVSSACPKVPDISRSQAGLVMGE